MRRSILCAVLTLFIVLTACSGPAADSTDASGEPAAGQTSAPTPEPTPEPTPTPTPEPAVEYYVRDTLDRSQYVLVEYAGPEDGVQYFIVDPEDSSRYVPVKLVVKNNATGENVSVGNDGTDKFSGYEYQIYTAPTLSQEQIDAALEEVMENYSAVSVSVGVIQDGVVTGSGAWGWAVKKEREMTADTKLRAASLSKLSVGLCAMAMAEDGLLELDAPLSTYWGEGVRNPYSKTQPSAYTLMTHTSSVKDLAIQGGLSNLRGKLQSTSSWRSISPASDPSGWRKPSHRSGGS